MNNVVTPFNVPKFKERTTAEQTDIQTDGQTHRRTDLVTSSLLEQLMAAKNSAPKKCVATGKLNVRDAFPTSARETTQFTGFPRFPGTESRE